MGSPRSGRRASALSVALIALIALAGARADQEGNAATPAATQAKPEAKMSNIVATAGEAPLPNGIGDVSPSGRCKADVVAFCKDLPPGEGRLGACLTERLEVERKGNEQGRKVSDACREELFKYKLDRNTNINKDTPLAYACKDDVAKGCPKASDASEPGSVIYCLRSNVGDKLSSACKKQVMRTVRESAEDYRLDPKLHSACSASADKLCAGEDAADVLPCLTTHQKELDWDCLEQVVRFQREVRFCDGVEPGHMRVQECLEDHMEEEGFGAGCKEELTNVMATRMEDFRLDATLERTCAEDIVSTCGARLEDLQKKETRARVINCLQSFRDELASQECQLKIHRQLSRASRDIRFDELLADACQEDRKKHCAEVQPGSARVIRCLQDARADLSQQCTAALFDHEVKMAEDIDFNYPMRRACAWEVATLCADVQHGRARVMRCLQDKLQHEDMSSECKAEVTRDVNRAAHDYRLNWRLKKACEEDIGAHCGGLCHTNSSQPCGGLVLHCLSDKKDKITSTACQEEVFYYQLMEVTDFRNDVILAEACRGDVDKYCGQVEPGEGRVHACLRHQMNFLSPACAAEESKLASKEARDIRLKPKLAKACGAERATFCRDVPPGQGRVIKCLLEGMSDPRFGAECRTALEGREDAVAGETRYEEFVRDACADDVGALCPGAKLQLRSTVASIKCLLEQFDAASALCQDEMSRMVRYALWDYSANPHLTDVCDADLASLCPKNAAARPGGAFTIGAAGRCLSRALVERRALAPACGALVAAAAPRDARAYLRAAPDSASTLVKRVADVQRAAGLEGVLVDPYASGGSGSVITVTGWAALACLASLAIVGLGAVVVVYRRLAGLDRPHTQYVKSGDA
ncbi:hypothetical protein Rsub_06937 [Raphidocelis subcapitata]|uniref:Golgi apparatus protein 1 n=1 Tax=Raphidocelis subcapitata TaxID=307507 RepID=A0A2V0PB42_9CHLO|nr:hypothetical protein Rsub_06937 [Raphidocelis subcapitata]|eukprot:GBF94315.1 hypothetical protein Rsub_06937 [Raphidocelis subcapitata]